MGQKIVDRTGARYNSGDLEDLMKQLAQRAAGDRLAAGPPTSSGGIAYLSICDSILSMRRSGINQISATSVYKPCASQCNQNDDRIPTL